MRKEHNNFLEVEELVCRDFYNYYRTNRRKVAKEIDQFKYFEKAVNGILTILRKAVLEEDEGVHIKSFGYLCNVKAKNKRALYTLKSPIKMYKKEIVFKFWYIPEDNYKKWYLKEITQLCVTKKTDYKIIDKETIKAIYETETYFNSVHRQAKDIKYFT
jgi:hypothetical protein